MVKKRNSPVKKRNSTNFKKYIKLSAEILIVAGLVMCVIGAFLIWQRYNPDRLSFKNYRGNFTKYQIANPPVRIVIIDVNIDLPIIPAKIIEKTWQTTTQGASYLVTSPVPGEKGNSIMYAHDWASLFGPLKTVKKNMYIQIIYSDNSSKVFIIKKISVVSPYDTRILRPDGTNKLTLYTCDGFWDTQRFVVTAEYKESTAISSNI